MKSFYLLPTFCFFLGIAVPWFGFDSFKWQPQTWSDQVANNHTKISQCYGLLIDNHIDQFSQACDITTILILENTIIDQFNKQHAKHPGTTREEFLNLYYPPNVAIPLLSHHHNQLRFNMTIMIMFIAETIINNNKQSE